MKFILEHVGLPAREPVALRDWYVRVFNAKVVFHKEQAPPFLLVMPGGGMIEIYQADSSMPEVANNKLSGWRHIALLVDDIEAAKTLLEQRGVKFAKPIGPAVTGGRMVYFQDPDGNQLHLMERPAGTSFI